MKLQEELEKLKNSDDGEKENGKSENGENKTVKFFCWLP